MGCDLRCAVTPERQILCVTTEQGITPLCQSGDIYALSPSCANPASLGVTLLGKRETRH